MSMPPSKPDESSPGREVTVCGVLENVLMRTIGEHPYTYPFVRAIQFYLWPEQREYEDDTWYPQIHFGVGFSGGLCAALSCSNGGTR
ncbi:MAG: Slp family lipoprotein [Gammaproteobacteria bacterium]